MSTAQPMLDKEETVSMTTASSPTKSARDLRELPPTIIREVKISREHNQLIEAISLAGGWRSVEDFIAEAASERAKALQDKWAKEGGRKRK